MVSGVSNCFSLPLVYHNMVVEHLIGEPGMGSGVISSSPAIGIS